MPLTAAERQAAHRAKTEVLRGQLEQFRCAFEDAVDRGRCSKALKGAPDEPTAWLLWATELLGDRRIILCQREDRPNQA